MGWARRLGIGVGAVVVGLGAVVGGAVAWGAATGQGLLQYPDWPSPAITASTEPEVIARGRYLVHGPAHCAQCHSGTDRENPAQVLTEPLHGGLSFEMGPIGTRYARNLTPDPETGIGRYTDAQLARAVRTGVMPDGEVSIFMAYSIASLSDEDLTAVISYLRSLPPVRREVPPGHYGLLAKVLLRFGAFTIVPNPVAGPAHVPPSDEPSVARGQYLAEHAAFCVSCHTANDPATFRPVGPKFAGGTPEPSHGADSDHEYAAPNLTSSPVGFTGKNDEEAFLARFKTGRRYTSSIMPWENLGNMTEADLRSIYRYLRTVPPVDVDSGPSYRPVGSFPPAQP